MYIFVEFVECKHYLPVMYFIVNICVLYFKVNTILYFNVPRQGGGKSLLPDLIKNGMTCDLRKLHVGDLLWVAREKTQTEAGKGR